MSYQAAVDYTMAELECIINAMSLGENTEDERSRQ